MGKASRSKQERRAETAAPAPEGGSGGRAKWIAIGGVLAGVAAIVVVLVVVTTGGSSSPPEIADQVAADANAPASLVAAADKVGFHQTTDPGTGVIEGKPASAAPAPHSPILLAEGAEAPDFELETPQGEVVKLADQRGKTVLLEFFATWCGLCNTEAPHVKAIAESLDPKRFTVMSINADAEDAASVFAFHRFYKLPFVSLLDPSLRPGSFNKPGVPGPITQQYGMKSLPTFYVIDPDGKVAWRSDGEQPDAKLREELERAAS